MYHGLMAASEFSYAAVEFGRVLMREKDKMAKSAVFSCTKLVYMKDQSVRQDIEHWRRLDFSIMTHKKSLYVVPLSP